MGVRFWQQFCRLLIRFLLAISLLTRSGILEFPARKVGWFDS
jgi:hypothetical protein